MAAGTIEKIQIILQTVTTGFVKGLGKAQTQLKSVGKNMQNLGAVMELPMQNFKIMNQVMGMSTQRFNKFAKGLAPEALQEFGLRMGKSGAFVDLHTKRVVSATNAQKRMTKQVATLGGKVGNSFRKLTHGMRGFRMEALGVMFFGMMMQRMFMGLLQPVLEAFGVFDIFRVMLLTLFLPVMEMIFPWLLKIMEWFMKLPEPTKKLIGILVILGLVFGTVIMILGQLALGIGSLIIFFGSLSSSLILIPLLLMGIAIGIPLIKRLVDWFKNLEKGVGETNDQLVAMGVPPGLITKITDLIKIAVDKMGGFFGMLKEKVSENMPTIMEALIDILKKALTWIEKSLPMIIEEGGKFLMALIKGIINNTDKIAEAVTKTINAFVKFLDENLEMIINFAIKILDTILKGMIDNIHIIGNAMAEIINALGKWIGEHSIDIIKLGVKFAYYIAKGIGDAIRSALTSYLQEVADLGIGTKIGTKIGRVFRGNNKDDFIWRPGQAPVSINPNDTLVGFKGAPPGIGGGGSIVQETNFYGFTMDDLKRELDERDRRMVDDIRRLVKT